MEDLFERGGALYEFKAGAQDPGIGAQLLAAGHAQGAGGIAELGRQGGFFLVNDRPADADAQGKQGQHGDGDQAY